MRLIVFTLSQQQQSLTLHCSSCPGPRATYWPICASHLATLHFLLEQNYPKMDKNRTPADASVQAPSLTEDVEKQTEPIASDSPQQKQSAFRNLGLLDRFLAVWIFLAMAIGIILGNFVPSTGPALQRGEFVGVSVPISEYLCCFWCVRLQSG